ncbi:Uncharacterised protein [Streptococcus pneumoniae]|nr:Uncharacterised protein [Streptococcus pneumoniae]
MPVAGQFDVVEVHHTLDGRDALGVLLRPHPEEEAGVAVRQRRQGLRHLFAQGHRLPGRVAVEEEDLAVRALLGERVQDRGGRGDADAGGRQDQGSGGVLVLEGDVAVGVGQLDDVADLHVLDEHGRDLAALVQLHGDDTFGGGLGLLGEGVLAALAQAVLYLQAHGHVAAGPAAGLRGVVGRLEAEGDGRVAGGLLRDDPPVRPHPVVGLLGVEALLDLDEGVGHEPVDLGPGVGHRGGDGVAEHLADGPEEVLVDDRVLLLDDAEGGVLVGDAGQDGLGQGARVLEQVHRELHDRAGEGLGLLAVALVGAGEDAVEELGVGLEHVGVKQGRDLRHVLGDDGGGGLDDGVGLLGQHGGLRLFGGESCAGFARLHPAVAVGNSPPGPFPQCVTGISGRPSSTGPPTGPALTRSRIRTVSSSARKASRARCRAPRRRQSPA